MGWWYGQPAYGQVRPDAAAALPGVTVAVLGRFGAPTRIDLAWADADTLYVLPAYGDLVGTDLDRDGFAAPEDCDDADPLVGPGASDPWDGMDNNCDGAVDEADDGLVGRFIGRAHSTIGASVTPLPDPTGDRVAWLEYPGELDVAALLTGERWVYDLDALVNRLASAGDFDGDGWADLVT